MALEPFRARSAHVVQFRPVTVDQTAEDVANNGEDMHPPNSPKLGPRMITATQFGQLEGRHAAGM
jgi:hypothetical protein